MARVRLNLRSLSVPSEDREGPMLSSKPLPRSKRQDRSNYANRDSSQCGSEVGPDVDSARELCRKRCRKRPHFDYERGDGDQSVSVHADSSNIPQALSAAAGHHCSVTTGE